MSRRSPFRSFKGELNSTSRGNGETLNFHFFNDLLLDGLRCHMVGYTTGFYQALSRFFGDL